MKHGNLHWDIEMDFKDIDSPEFCNTTSVNVRRYSFTRAWIEACELYDTEIEVRGNELTGFTLRLRFDNLGSHAFEIVQSWVLQSLDKADEFFKNVQHAFKALRRQ